MNRQRRLTIASLALVVAVAGACGGKSGGSETADKKKGEAATADAAKAADAAADPNAATSASTPNAGKATDKKSTAAAGSKEAGSASATTTSLDLSAFLGDYVFGSPRAMSGDDPRPPGCGMKYGEMCLMQITGTYQLKTAEVASIHVGAYEDGAEEPAFHTSLPNAKKGSSHWYIDKFPYQAREGVKEMRVLVKLLDAKGKELARGKPTIFPIEFFQKL